MHQVKIKNIKAVPGAIHLGDKTTLVVPDTQDFIAGQHLAAPLIQLSDANDA